METSLPESTALLLMRREAQMRSGMARDAGRTARPGGPADDLTISRGANSSGTACACEGAIAFRRLSSFARGSDTALMVGTSHLAGSEREPPRRGDEGFPSWDA